jgi:hypothetical protein
MTAEGPPTMAEDQLVTAEDPPTMAEDQLTTAEGRPMTAEDRPMAAEDQPMTAEERRVAAEDQLVTGLPAAETKLPLKRLAKIAGLGNYWWAGDCRLAGRGCNPPAPRPVLHNYEQNNLWLASG